MEEEVTNYSKSIVQYINRMPLSSIEQDDITSRESNI